MANKLLPGDVIASATVSPGLMNFQMGDIAALRFQFLDEPSLGSFGEGRGKMELSPDAQVLLVGSGSNVTLYRTTGDGYVEPSSAPQGTAGSVAWNHDGSVFAVGHSSIPYLTQYTYPDLTKLPEVKERPTGEVVALDYNHDGSLLVVGRAASTKMGAGFYLYDTATGEKLPDPDVPMGSNAAGLQFSPDGRWLVAVGRSDTYPNCQVYDMTDLSVLQTLVRPTLAPAVTSQIPVAFNPTGTRLAMGGNQSPYLVLYDTTTTPWTRLLPLPSVPNTTLGAVSNLAWLSDSVLVYQQPDQIVAIDVDTLEFLAVAPLKAVSGFVVYPGGSRRKLSGVVTDGRGNFLRRTVRAIERSTGRWLGETESDPVDGTFTLEVFCPNPAIVYCVGEGAEVSKLVDGVVPVAV